MTDYQIYNYIYLFVVSFFTICAVQRYKTQLVNNLRQDNINNNNWGYPTETLLSHGLNDNNDELQEVAGVWIYPTDVLCPMDHTQANKLNITDRTVSIHLYDCSWINHNTIRYKLHLLKNLLARRFGVKFINKCINIMTFRK